MTQTGYLGLITVLPLLLAGCNSKHMSTSEESLRQAIRTEKGLDSDTRGYGLDNWMQVRDNVVDYVNTYFPQMKVEGISLSAGSGASFTAKVDVTYNRPEDDQANREANDFLKRHGYLDSKPSSTGVTDENRSNHDPLGILPGNRSTSAVTKGGSNDDPLGILPKSEASVGSLTRQTIFIHTELFVADTGAMYWKTERVTNNWFPHMPDTGFSIKTFKVTKPDASRDESASEQ